MASRVSAWQQSLVATKLFTPLPRADFVSRPRLLQRLEAARAAHHKLVLISAPAGSGKTTLVSEWCDTHKQRIAWLALDADDNDPTRFALYILAACKTFLAAPEAMDALANGLVLGGPSFSLQNIFTALLNFLSANDTRDFAHVLVLDDYHVIQHKPIHDAVGFFIEHTPPHLQIVLTTRSDPSLPLARWRTRAQMTELRARDLQFTLVEATEFLNRGMGLALSPEQVAAVDERVEGWIAGLQLAAITLEGRGDADEFIRAFTGSHRFVLDYLIQEVLQSEPRALTEFMLATSVLERMNVELANAVTGRTDARVMLDELERANLFLIPQDDTRVWYRYHHLFAEVLQSRLREHHAAENVPAPAVLHQRASDWFGQNNFPNEAIHHAHAAKDYARVQLWIEKYGVAFVFAGNIVTVKQWLQLVPPGSVTPNAQGFLIQASIYLFNDEFDKMDAAVESAEQAIAQLADAGLREFVAREASLLRVLSMSFRGAHAAVIEAGETLLGTLPTDAHGTRGELLFRLAVAHVRLGNTARAPELFQLSEQEARRAADYFQVILTLSNHAELCVMLGQLERAKQLYLRAFQVAGRQALELHPIIPRLQVDLALLYVETHDFENAARYAEHARVLAENSQLTRQTKMAYAGLAKFALARGELAQARRWFEQALGEQPLPGNPRLYLYNRLAQVQLYLWLAEGNLAAALEWVEQSGSAFDDAFNSDMRLTQWAIAETWIANQMYARALTLLERLHQTATQNGWRGDLVLVEALKALALAGAGEKSQALDAIEHALEYGARERYIQTFLARGPAMRALLVEFRARLLTDPKFKSIANAKSLLTYLEQLLAAFPQTQSATALKAENRLVEPLTERELEVLALVVAGHSNLEIAETLVLTVGTVKSHLNRIFGKLGVSSRTQAIVRARALGLFDLPN